jgi:hypothetical protein
LADERGMQLCMTCEALLLIAAANQPLPIVVDEDG